LGSLLFQWYRSSLGRSKMRMNSSRIPTHFHKPNYLSVNREKPAIVLGDPPKERLRERKTPLKRRIAPAFRRRFSCCDPSPTSFSRFYSHLPNIAQTAGIVVTNPTRASVEPTAFRCSPLRRSARSSAIPAPIIARVAIMNASSGRVSRISFTQKSR
jgi:hypothetical protein